jgi:cytochrome c biogenesis protein CcmG/thiol:disulfide interchange protein DsbE
MIKRQSTVSLLITSICAATIGCGAATDDSPAVSSGATKGLVANPAPAFSLAVVANGTGKVTLEDLLGKVVLLDFWGTFCEPCKKSFPRLQDLNAKYGASGLKIVGVSEDEPDDKDKISDFASAYGAKFTLGWDEDRSIARSYKPETMPSSFLIDKSGIVRYTHVGYHDGDQFELEKEVKELLAQ